MCVYALTSSNRLLTQCEEIIGQCSRSQTTVELPCVCTCTCQSCELNSHFVFEQYKNVSSLSSECDRGCNPYLITKCNEIFFRPPYNIAEAHITMPPDAARWLSVRQGQNAISVSMAWHNGGNTCYVYAESLFFSRNIFKQINCLNVLAQSTWPRFYCLFLGSHHDMHNLMHNLA